MRFIRPEPHRQRKWVRDAVFKRDRGLCAMCGLDTEALRLSLRAEAVAAGWWYSSGYGGDSSPGQRLWMQRCQDHGMSWRLSFWSADHILPFAEGGACSLENLRTLCRPCHRKVTKEWITQKRESQWTG
jgi:5-methylcytosine-specific restriction endonuclease McrA